MSGRDVCRAQGPGAGASVIVLGAASDVADKILLLELGADYVTKPFSPRELLARVRAALARRPQLQRGRSLWLVRGNLRGL